MCHRVLNVKMCHQGMLRCVIKEMLRCVIKEMLRCVIEELTNLQ